MSLPPRRAPISRIETFGDAMIAVAATLLIMSSDPPREYGDLIANVYIFMPVALSFAALFYVWYIHTTLWRRYPLNDGLSMALNGALLLFIVFFVHPLKFMVTTLLTLLTSQSVVSIWSPGELRHLFILFAIGWITVFGLIALLHYRAHVTREPLRLTPVEAYDAVTFSRHYAGFVAAGVISLLLAFARIGIGYAAPALALATLFIFAWLNNRARAPGRDLLATKIAQHPQLADTMAIDTSTIRDALK